MSSQWKARQHAGRVGDEEVAEKFHLDSQVARSELRHTSSNNVTLPLTRPNLLIVSLPMSPGGHLHSNHYIVREESSIFLRKMIEPGNFQKHRDCGSLNRLVHRE